MNRCYLCGHDPSEHVASTGCGVVACSCPEGPVAATFMPPTREQMRERLKDQFIAAASPPDRIPGHLQGDGPCSRCGGPVVSGWFTSDVFWNNVVRSAPLPWLADTPNPDGDGLMCMECFVLLANERGFRPTGWSLVPEWPWRREASEGS